MVSFRGLLSLAVVLMLALPVVATADPGMTVQSVSTDKATYAPGDTVADFGRCDLATTALVDDSPDGIVL